MATVKTVKVSIYVPRKRINEVIGFLQREAVFEPKAGGKSLAKHALADISAEQMRCERAIKIAKKYRPPGFLKYKRRSVWEHSLSDDTARETIDKILDAEKQLEKIRARYEEIRELSRKLSAFSGFLYGSFFEESEKTESVTLVYSGKEADSAMQRLRDEGIYCEAYGKRQLILRAVYLKRDKKRAEGLFSELSLTSPDFELSGKTPDAELRELNEELQRLDAQKSELNTEIERLAKLRKRMELYYDRLLLKRSRYSSFAAAANTEKVFILTGYAEKDRFDEIYLRLKKIGALMEETAPLDGEVLPTAFRNNALISPVEGITEGYSMPSAKDLDPNPVMAVFYYWFFGMMFSDAGYGILMMAVCGALGYSELLRKNKRGMYKMFFWCGLSTTLWGLLYGSFFGDLISVVSKTFAGGDAALRPILLDPVNQALELLILSVAFGLLHILTALGVRFYKDIKNGERESAFYDTATWFAVLSGIALFAAGAFLGLKTLKVSGAVLALFGAMVLVLMSGRDKKSPVSRLLSGVLSLYDITSYVGDILSYSRLMALGLATGVIAQVVNVLASLSGNSPIGAVIFVLIAVLGHSLNFAINMLGAYVHTNRLQYVEFYQKFYEGGGRRFAPMRRETKYFDADDIEKGQRI